MDLNVKLPVFEGPLDLLLHLLEKNKVNIYDIPIVEITNQYLEYVAQLQGQDLNSMSDFLVMAATLISIKSKMLLPPEETDEEEEDPRAQLVQQLLEYKMYKCISMELRDLQLDADKLFYKDPTIPREVAEYELPVDLSALMKDVTLEKLEAIFQDMVRRQEDRVDPVRSKFGRIEKEEISQEEKMSYVLDYATNNQQFSFRQLLKRQKSRSEIVVTFLCVLELMKMGKISIVQEEIFDDIMITRNF